MSKNERDFAELVAEIDRGELPWATAIPACRALLNDVSPVYARAFHRFERLARIEAQEIGVEGCWRLVALGLVDPARLLPRAFARARATLNLLRDLSPTKRLRLLLALRAPAPNPALVDLLIAEGRQAAASDLAAAHAWLDLAEEELRRLQGIGLPSECLAGPALRLLAHRANAHRLAGDLARSAVIFAGLADDPRRYVFARLDLHAELLLLESLLRTDRRDFAEADRLLARAGRLYRLIADSAGQAKTLLQHGNVADYAGDSVAAVESYQQAMQLLDPAAQSKLYLMTQHNLASNLVQLGRAAEAAAVMAASHALYEAHDDPVNRLRRSWLEGRIARAEERWDDAERLLVQTRDAALTQGMAYDAALASLDLAELYLANGRTAKVKALARQLVPIFESQGVHREALAALLLFQKAARAQRLSAELVARLRRYLLLARNDPSFRFDAGPAQASSSSPSSASS